MKTTLTTIRSCKLATLIAAATLCAAGPAAALNPRTRLEDFNHTIWTTRDGAPPGIQSMAQTPDGWLWLSTPAGLYRFDGVRFERFRPRGGDMPRQRVFGLAARANGDLYVSYMGGGVSVIHKNGELEQIAPLDSPNGIASTFAVDSDGSLWTAGPGGVHQYAKGKWRQAGPQAGLPATLARTVLMDQYGQLWVSTETELFVRRQPGARFDQVPFDGVNGRLTQSPDGRLWMAAADGVRLIPNPAAAANGAGKPRAAFFNQSESRVGGQFDRDGNLWSIGSPSGLSLMSAAAQRPDAVLDPAAQASGKLDQPWQMSSLVASGVLEDMEGNVWISTQAGLERFRENKIIPAHVPGANETFSMARGADDSVWMVDQVTATAWHFSGAAAPVADRRQAYRRVANDRDGALLLAGPRTIERRYQGQVTQIPLPRAPDGKEIDINVLGMLDDGAVLWVATAQFGMLGLVDGTWRPRSSFNLPPRLYVGAAAGKGQMWLTCPDGSIQFYDNGKLTPYDGSMVGFFTGIFTGADIVAGGEKGLAVLLNGSFRKLNAPHPEVLNGVSGMAVTAEGDRWFNGGKGLVRVRADDWRAAMARPDLPLRLELIDALEGYPGQAAVSSRLASILASADGKLWIMTTEGPVTLDPNQLRRNAVPPQTNIRHVSAGGKDYPPLPGLRLPPATQSLSVAFTAAALGKPERVAFQYQLAGVDAGWQDAGARREAYYTNVEPGAYTFKVRAMNEDGLAGTEETALRFNIAPTFQQTLWFKALCLFVGAGALYLLYIYRLRAATAKVAERLQVRMAERERIARTLHDTFLQNVQGIVLRLEGLSMELPGDSGARGKLASILEHADSTIVEGRDQVHELRSGHVGDVADSIQRATRLQQENNPGTALSLQVEGARAELQAQVAEEVCSIATEAVNNAFRHAHGSKIEVRLGFDTVAFTLTVTDNGKGMPPPAQEGQDGQAGHEAEDGRSVKHWGLLGMRERAGRIGGKLDIDGNANGGTRVKLSVPAALAYTGARRRWPRWLAIRTARNATRPSPPG
ncbi:triple tyrosine motif-containing protein [Pseudoduganella sp. LjRoot289]|uniref:sensor histidine kinase n=1 Tax=Pseudoduganella sp. LjRoot289 TaxID=3342314 RepID=UPI003ED069C1